MKSLFISFLINFALENEKEMKRTIFLLLIALFSYNIKAQTNFSSNKHAVSQSYWQELFNQLKDEENDENVTWGEVYETLSEVFANPININQATKESLEEIPFLKIAQIDEILKYLYYHDGMKTIQELRMIESLSRTECSLLMCFVYCGDKDKNDKLRFNDIMKYGKHNLVLSGNVPFYDREGDIKGYEGYKYRHSFRYTFNYSNRVKLGFIGAQDAGEPFFSGKNSLGYDFYSFYLQMKNFGKIKNLVLGRYRLSYGMGLVLNNDLGFGKYATMLTLGQGKNIIRGHSSRSSANYLQGVAATLSLTRNLELSAFASYRKFDATLNNDGTISTILQTGYHRTPTEFKHKDNSSHVMFGGHLQWNFGGLHLGATGYSMKLNRALSPNKDILYKRYYPKGSDFWNVGINYSYLNSKFQIAGETATGGSHSVATINSVSWMPSSSFSLSAIQRYYGYKYYSMFSCSLSEGGRVQNESGMLISANWKPFRWLSLMCYSDYVYFPWARYYTSASSHAFDNMAQAMLFLGKFTIEGRYRRRDIEKDMKNDDNTVRKTDIQNRARFRFSFNDDRWNLRTQFDFVSSSYNDKSNGYMISQNIACAALRRLSLYGNIGYFNTDDYASRVYTYEHSMLYSFSFPSYFGEGIRYAVGTKIDISRNLIAEAKVGTTKYFDRSCIGSGLSQINKSYKNDLELQLRVKLP